MRRSAASGGLAELVVVVEGTLDDVVKRRGRAGRVQLPEAVIAEAVARDPFGDLVQRHEGGGAGVPLPGSLPQRRRRAEQPGGALVAALGPRR